jgi:hypothetical protein
MQALGIKGKLMNRSLLLIVLVFLLIGCVSKEYKNHVQGVISYELDSELNRFSEKHVVCYVCETGNVPVTVTQITTYKAKTEACSSLFNEKEISFFQPEFKDYIVNLTTLEGRDVYVFTKEGLSLDEVGNIRGKEPWFSMALWYNKHDACLTKRSTRTP